VVGEDLLLATNRDKANWFNLLVRFSDPVIHSVSEGDVTTVPELACSCPSEDVDHYLLGTYSLPMRVKELPKYRSTVDSVAELKNGTSTIDANERTAPRIVHGFCQNKRLASYPY